MQQCACYVVPVHNVCPIQLTLALWQFSRPLPSRFTGSAPTALQLIALITGVSHLGPKVLARELSLPIGGGAWITAGHNCRRVGEDAPRTKHIECIVRAGWSERLQFIIK